MNQPGSAHDTLAQHRAFYFSLLRVPGRFSEFKELLTLYPRAPEAGEDEPDHASSIRLRLNEQIRSWVGGRFDGFSASQVQQWRAIVVEERIGAPGLGRETTSC
jgi:hypothetical protein